MQLNKIIKNTINQYLNEASFFTFNNDQILTDKYIKELIEDGSAEGYIDWYMGMHNLEDYDENEIVNTPEFRSFFRNELEEFLEEAKENLHDKIDYNSNKVKLYRAITVDDNWLHHLKTQGKRLGIYWSWDEHGAETHWGDYTKKNVAVLEAEIDEKYIDWQSTLELNLHPNYTEEKEIRLFKNTPIKLNSIEINDKEIDLSILNNKTFYA